MSKTNKLPPATDWQARDISDWNTLTFTEYLKDEHKRIFGVDYAPMRSWRVEQGLIGNLIGTRTKEGTASKAMVKRFIDECFATYKPTREYPGTSFGFSWAYRKNVWQRLQAEEASAKRAQVARESEAQTDLEELAEWL